MAAEDDFTQPTLLLPFFLQFNLILRFLLFFGFGLLMIVDGYWDCVRLLTYDCSSWIHTLTRLLVTLCLFVNLEADLIGWLFFGQSHWLVQKARMTTINLFSLIQSLTTHQFNLSFQFNLAFIDTNSKIPFLTLYPVHACINMHYINAKYRHSYHTK